MLTRDSESYFSSLYDVFCRRQEKDRTLLPALVSFYAAKTAVILRMKAIDYLADKFERFANQPNRSVERAKRSPEENQLLFDFFANGLAALESFTFGSYYLGVGIDGNKFDINKARKTIRPQAVLKSFKNFAPTDKFTLALEKCLTSRKCEVIKAMRNTLLHTVAPGPTIQLSSHTDSPDFVDLDQWYKGDWQRAWGGVGLPQPVLTFSLEPTALNKQRDWIDEQLEQLSSSLCDLASAYRFN
jgi:hypothetical protein